MKISFLSDSAKYDYCTILKFEWLSTLIFIALILNTNFHLIKHHYFDLNIVYVFASIVIIIVINSKYNPFCDFGHKY